MGHKHTPWLAAAFSFLAVAQLLMIVGFQKEVNSISDSSFDTAMNASILHRSGRAIDRLKVMNMNDVQVVGHRAVAAPAAEAMRRAAERSAQ